MQIRERNGRVECLRAVWDAAAKRSRQKLIKAEEFTEAERVQFDAWQAERRALDAEKAKSDIASIGHVSVSMLAEAVESGHMPPEPEKLLAALDRLNKALRKAGVKRPARVAKQHHDTKTADLLSN